MAVSEKLKGRPTLVTAERSKIVCDAIREGLTREDAATLAGVHRDTVYAWEKTGREALALLDEGEQLESHYQILASEHFLAYQRAVIDRKRELLLKVQNARSNHEVAAGTWLLETFAPNEFGRKQRVEHSGPDGGPMQTSVAVQIIALPPLKNALELADPSAATDSVAPESGSADGVSKQSG